MKGMDEIRHILDKIYGSEKGSLAFERIAALMKKFPVKAGQGKGYFSEKDVFLITYGDTLNQKGEVPLRTLHKFAGQQFKDVFSTIHILPFFPFSSDDGFSVMDFFTVNPELGAWDDLQPLGENFKLMFDLVLNHVSAQSTWFQNYLEEVPGFEKLAIEVDPAIDLSLVTRPRSLPLLTEFEKSSGKTVYVWTTFSADQIDLNFKSLDVLLKMIEALLFYVKQGGTSIRLDAIAYLWKEIGTTCIHLSSTHEIVKLFRSILDVAAPEVILITETNVPHVENISYFGNGRNEAQMVYNFTLPPLLFYTFVSEDTTVLSDWAKGLHLTSDSNTFFNFTASHDGVGVRPLEGILPQAEIDKLIQTVKANGGRVSYKKNTDGSESPYELNITYVDAFCNQASKTDPLHTKRFLASQSIQYALPGVPATYIHSILGSRNWQEGVRQTQRARTINREKLQVDNILSQLKDPGTFRSRIFYPYIELIKVRRKQPALHPNASFEVLEIDPKVFGIARYCKEQTIYALTNTSSQQVVVGLDRKGIPLRLKDLFSGKECGTHSLRMDPYEYLWLSSY